MIAGPAVLVPRHLAQPLLELAVAEASRRALAGRVLGDELKQLLGDLARAARQEIPVPTGSDGGSDRFRGSTLEGVTTTTAATALGISPRAVVKQIHAGRLTAEQQPDGRWLINPKDIPA